MHSRFMFLFFLFSAVVIVDINSKSCFKEMSDVTGVFFPAFEPFVFYFGALTCITSNRLFMDVSILPNLRL